MDISMDHSHPALFCLSLIGHHLYGYRDGQSETVSLDGFNYIIRNVKGLF